MSSQVIQFQCNACQAVLTVPIELAGVTGPCPKCGQTITSPSAPPSEAPPPAAPPPAQSAVAPPSPTLPQVPAAPPPAAAPAPTPAVPPPVQPEPPAMPAASAPLPSAPPPAAETLPPAPSQPAPPPGDPAMPAGIPPQSPAPAPQPTPASTGPGPAEPSLLSGLSGTPQPPAAPANPSTPASPIPTAEPTAESPPAEKKSKLIPGGPSLPSLGGSSDPSQTPPSGPLGDGLKDPGPAPDPAKPEPEEEEAPQVRVPLPPIPNRPSRGVNLLRLAIAALMLLGCMALAAYAARGPLTQLAAKYAPNLSLGGLEKYLGLESSAPPAPPPSVPTIPSSELVGQTPQPAAEKPPQEPPPAPNTESEPAVTPAMPPATVSTGDTRPGPATPPPTPEEEVIKPAAPTETMTPPAEPEEKDSTPPSTPAVDPVAMLNSPLGSSLIEVEKPLGLDAMSVGPAPGAIAPSEINLSIQVPDEAKPALDALTAFLSAATVEEKRKYILFLDDEEISALVDRYYTLTPPKKVEISNVGYIRHDPNPEVGGGTQTVFMVSSPEWTYPIPVMIQETEDGHRIDWVAYVEFKDEFLLKFASLYRPDPGRFHVSIKRAHYFEDDVPALDQKDCYVLQPPQENYEVSTFVPKGTPLAEALSSVVSWNTQMAYVIADIRWRQEGDYQWIELIGVPQMNWYAKPAKSGGG